MPTVDSLSACNAWIAHFALPTVSIRCAVHMHCQQILRLITGFIDFVIVVVGVFFFLLFREFCLAVILNATRVNETPNA